MPFGSYRALRDRYRSLVAKQFAIASCRLFLLAATSCITGGLIVMMFGPTLRLYGIENVAAGAVVCILVLLIVSGIRRFQRDADRSRRVQRELSKRLLVAHENERRYLARELHDQLGQLLTAIKLRIEWLAKRSSDAAWYDKVLEAVSMVDTALSQTRQLAVMLNPPEVDVLGLPAALAWQVKSLFADTEIHLQLDADPIEPRPDRLIETIAFRVAQESLTNVVRHSRARNVAVRLRQAPGRLRLHIIDDGIGFNVDSIPTSSANGGLGIPGMRERTLLAGGELTVRSSVGTGTEIQLSLPLELPIR